ncbi:MAG: AraC family transcriptional regulator [Oscillospiraceae bacterium]
MPLLITQVIYQQAMEALRQQTYKSTLHTMKTSAESVEQTFDSVNELLYYISNSNLLVTFSKLNKLEEDNRSIEEIRKAQKYLSDYKNTNKLLSGVQIYAKKNEFLIDSSTTALVLGRYYNSAFRIEGMGEEEWKADLLEGMFHKRIFPSTNIYIAADAKPRVMYAHTISSRAGGAMDANIFVFFNTEDLLEFYSGIAYQDGGFLAIYDRSGEAVLQDNPSAMDIHAVDFNQMTDANGYFFQTIDGTQMLLTYMKGSSQNWSYVTAIPMTQVLAPVEQLRTSLTLLIVLTLAVGILLVFFAAYRASRPVVSVYNAISRSAPGVSLSAEDLGEQIGKLVTTNNAMREELELQVPLLQVAVVNNFLNGVFVSEEEIRENMAQVGLIIHRGNVAVLIATFNDMPYNSALPELGVYKSLIKDVFRDNIRGLVYAQDMDLEQIVLLVNAPQKDAASAMEQLETDLLRCREALSKTGNIHISYVGTMTDSLMGVPALFSYMKTGQLQEHHATPAQVQWYGNNGDAGFYYPVNMENELAALVQGGNPQAAARLFEHIRSLNGRLFHEPEPAGAYQLLQSLYATLLRYNLADNWADTGLLDRIKEQQNAGLLYDRIRDFCVEAAARQAEAEGQRSTIREQIIDFVEHNFQDPQISLSHVAAHFDITEAYLSRLFKQSAGMNFTKYVEKLRVERAEELIGERRYQVNEIARMVGYNSPQVFRRAHKRYHDSGEQTSAQ